MAKVVFSKFCVLNNVVGRVDYISNPKRQENLLAFYQTPQDPKAFWKALSEESQEQDKYNRAQMDEYNRRQKERYEAGEIKTLRLRKTVEARENILALPLNLTEIMEPQQIAQLFAEDIKDRYGIECAVGVHLNKEKTCLHAHIILPERRMLEVAKESVATRNTYYNENGKRSTKSVCTVNGELKPGCRMVAKGEILSSKRFSDKDSIFATKGFMYGEKRHYAALYTQLTGDQWEVYNHLTNPHLRLMNIVRGEPERLTAWKIHVNEENKAYNAAIDKMLENGEITYAQALDIKKRIYVERAETKKKREERREQWISGQTHLPTYRSTYTGHKSLLELTFELALVICGYDPNDELYDEYVYEDPIVPRVVAYHNKVLQNMVDDLAHAAGRKSATELIAERNVQRIANEVRKPSLSALIGDAEGKRPGDSELFERDGRIVRQ